MADEPEATHGEVELRVPASGAFVSILRTITAGLAARCDLTLDEIEDLRIAVDEACALLLPHAESGSSLTARFTLLPGSLDFLASVPAGPDAQPDRDGFAWSVLRALADDVHVSTSDRALAIGISKRRAPLAQ